MRKTVGNIKSLVTWLNKLLLSQYIFETSVDLSLYSLNYMNTRGKYIIPELNYHDSSL